MNVIEEIEEELKRISPSPWDWYDSDPNWLWQRTGPGKHDWGKPLNVEAVEATEADRNFIAKSPERISALIEYVRATQDYLDDLYASGFIDRLNENVFQGWKSAKRLQAARKALGLTED